MGEKESHAMRVCAKCEMSISNSVAKGVWNIHLTLTKFHKYNVFFFQIYNSTHRKYAHKF